MLKEKEDVGFGVHAFGNGLDVGHELDLGCVLIECTSPLC
jgi:hypothetical protein